MRAQRGVESALEVEPLGSTHSPLHPRDRDAEDAGLPIHPRLDPPHQRVAVQDGQHVVPVLALLLRDVDLPQVVEIEKLAEELAVRVDFRTLAEPHGKVRFEERPSPPRSPIPAS